MGADEEDSNRKADEAGRPADGSSALEVVRGRVAGLVKGGYEVELPDGPGFCSVAQIDVRRVTDASSFLHRELDFVVLATDEETGRRRLSRRRLLEREARAQAAAVRRRAVPGATLRGRVCRLAEFGAFIDLGGLEGMVHVSEISHRRLERPSDALRPGDEVEVKVLRVGRGKGGRISLSIKGAQADPWHDVAQRFERWRIVDGRIVRVEEFGAFLELEPGVEGLLHVSELPAGSLPRLEEAAGAGALMAVVVLEVDPERRRIALAPAPRGSEAGSRLEPVPLRPGRIVSGRVEGVQASGVTIRLGPGQLGVIPPPETGTPRGSDPRAEFPPGVEVEAEVIRVESGGRRARLSRKRALRRREREEVERHTRSQTIPSLSTLGEILDRARSRGPS